jgi:hypothetical protein
MAQFVTAFCEAYCDASFTALTVQMLAAIVVGLGLAQTTGGQSELSVKRRSIACQPEVQGTESCVFVFDRAALTGLALKARRVQ